MATSLETTYDYCILKIDSDNETVPGTSIIKPDLSRESLWTATCMSAGPQWFEPHSKTWSKQDWLKPGMRVLVNRFAGTVTTLDELRAAGFELTEEEARAEYRMVELFDIWCQIDGDRLVPFGDFVLAKRPDKEVRTTGGLIIPDMAQKNKNQFEVLAVGPGRIREDGTHQPLDIQPGDLLVTVPNAGLMIKFLDEEYLCAQPFQILSKLEEVPDVEQIPDDIGDIGEIDSISA